MVLARLLSGWHKFAFLQSDAKLCLRECKTLTRQLQPRLTNPPYSPQLLLSCRAFFLLEVPLLAALHLVGGHVIGRATNKCWRQREGQSVGHVRTSHSGTLGGVFSFICILKLS